jgi:hypothetical protein
MVKPDDLFSLMWEASFADADWDHKVVRSCIDALLDAAAASR